MQTAAQFWSKVLRGQGCWLWLGARKKNNGQPGYGHLRWRGKHRGAHQVAFELHHGRPPVGVLRHSCDNKQCCNPDHLLEGTHADNNADTACRGRGRHQLLTHAQALEIYQSELPAVQLAAIFGVSRSAINSIRNGRSWGHATGHAAWDAQARKSRIRAALRRTKVLRSGFYSVKSKQQRAPVS